jgi:hypothetical protein
MSGTTERMNERILREAVLQASCFWCERLHPAKHPLSVCPLCVGLSRERGFPMGSLEMNGSYPLTDVSIDEVLTRTSPGNYALGYMNGGRFMVFYVGRSDSDLRRRLHEWVGAPSHYDRYAPAAHAAWGVARGSVFPLDVPTQARVGNGVDSSYTRFAYSYASSAEAAFEKECRNYDDFGGSEALDNTAPPCQRRIAPSERVEHRV